MPMPERRRILLVQLAATTCLGPLLAMLGPFGTFALAPFGERLIYWTGLMLAAFALYRPAWAAARGWAAALRLSFAAMAAAAVALASLPMTLIVWLASFRHTPSLWPGPLDFVALYGSVVLVGALIALGFRLAERLLAEPAPASAPAEERPPAFLDRLPPQLRGRLIALEMEDHYLRVHTEAGDALILMPMRDAVAQLDPKLGARVHRSWWVAHDAVAGVRREGRSLRLDLVNGLSVPVARERAAELRAARLLPA
jgi:hypothetical protein